MLIYQIIHTESGYKYIGQTSRPAIKRWREHLYPLRKGRHHNKYLQSAWNKYGEHSFKFEIIKEFNSLEELNKAEIDLIRSGSDLYNLAKGGNGFNHSYKIKKTIGEANKIPIIGMNIKTGEIKPYASAADTAVDGFTPACIRKCVLRHISYRKDNSSFTSISHKGWVWTDDLINYEEKLKELTFLAKRAKIRLERSVIGISIFTNEIKNFKSATEASKFGFNLTTIRRCCIGEVKAHKGFIWVFGDVDNPQSLLERKKKDYINNPPLRGPKSWL